MGTSSAEEGQAQKGRFQMLLYTSSAGRLGMLVLARVKKAIFSLDRRQWEKAKGWGGRSHRGAALARPHGGWGWLSSSPEALDLRLLVAALAPDLVHVLGCRPQHLLHPLLLQLLLMRLSRNGGQVSPARPRRQPEPGQDGLTCFSACLRRSRKRSSSRTQAGSSLRPCCRASSSWPFSSRSTCSSRSSRARRVRDTCRSSSRSREVRRRPSRLLKGTGG